ELHPEVTVRKNLRDRTIELQQFFFRHPVVSGCLAIASVAARFARAVQECNISQPVWLAFPVFRMVGLWPGIVVPMAALLAVLLVFAPVMGPAVLAVGCMVRSRVRRRLAGATVGCRNCHADQPFDVAEIGPLFVIAKRNRNALGAGTSGTADAVNIAFGNVGQVVVDHVS